MLLVHQIITIIYIWKIASRIMVQYMDFGTIALNDSIEY